MTTQGQIARVLQLAGHEYAGTSAEETAAEWISYGFAAEDVKAWLEADCWEPAVAAECRKAGLTPDDAVEVIGESMYELCNGDAAVSDFI
jgi:20S proteasome alpha/beta subunit